MYHKEHTCSLQGDWGAQAAAAWAPRRNILYHCFPHASAGEAPGDAESNTPATEPLQAARLAASWNGQVHIFLVPYTVALSQQRTRQRPAPGADAPSASNAGSPSAVARAPDADAAASVSAEASDSKPSPLPPPQTQQQQQQRAPLHLQPQCERTVVLGAGEVAAQLGWVATGGSDADSGYKLLVLAVPALAGEALASGSRDGARRMTDHTLRTRSRSTSCVACPTTSNCAVAASTPCT